MQKFNLVKLGVIKSAHGIRGECLVKSFTQKPSDIFKFDLLDKSANKISIKKTKTKNEGDFVCKIEGVNDRNMAEDLKGSFLFCVPESFPDIFSNKTEEYYHEDIKNTVVYDTHDNEFGIVNDVLNYGAGDILEIKKNSSGECEFYPFTKEVFPHVTKDKIIIDLEKYQI